MKTLAVYPVCWALFGIGHVASLLLHRLDDNTPEPSRAFDAVYRVYQSTMTGSFRLQRWAEGKHYSRILPWHAPE